MGVRRGFAGWRRSLACLLAVVVLGGLSLIGSSAASADTTLPATGSVTGSVTYVIPGSVADLHSPGGLVTSMPVGSDGFEFTDLAPGAYDLDIGAPGLLTEGMTFDVVAGQTTTLVMTGTVTGTAHDVAPGTLVSLDTPSGQTSLGSVPVGANGSFDFTGVGPGNYVLEVGAAQSFPFTVNIGQTTVLAPGQTTGTAAGTVPDVDPGTVVLLYPASDDTAAAASTTVGADGSFEFDDVPPGSYTLTIGSTQYPTFTVVAGETTTVATPGAISGVATDADPGAIVDLFARGDLTTPAASTSLGSDGSFAFTDVAPGAYKLEFGPSPTAWLPSPSNPLYYVVEAGMTKNLGLFATRGTFTGTLPGVDPGTLVYLYSASDGTTPVVSTAVGSDGSFKFMHVPPGTYKLEIGPSGINWYYGLVFSDSVPFNVGAGSTTALGTWNDPLGSLSDPAGSVDVTVTGAGGAPFPQGYGETEKLVASTTEYGGDLVEAGTVNPTSSGDFVLSGLYPGVSYSLKFHDPQGLYLDQWVNFEVSSGTTTPVVVHLLQPMPLPATSAEPQVTGTAQVGQQLTINPGTWSAPGVKLSYLWGHWASSGLTYDIPGATGTTYKPMAADVGKRLAVEIMASAPGYQSAWVSSAPSASVVAGLLKDSVPPRLVENGGRVGWNEKVSSGTWSPAAQTVVGYQWLRNGVAIPGAKHALYRAVAADTGKRLSVNITASDPGYVTSKSTIGPTALIKTNTTTKVTAKAVGHGKLAVTVTVRGSGLLATGKVKITLGTRKVMVSLKSGKATEVFARLRKGRRQTIAATYAAQSFFLPSAASTHAKAS